MYGPKPEKATNWTEIQLYKFHGEQAGGGPVAPVIFDKAGCILGTTGIGGDYIFGLPFELMNTATGWKEKVLHSFGAPGDGAFSYV